MSKLNVQVVYALADEHDMIELSVAEGSTLKDAILASGLLLRHSEIDLEQAKVGVFSKLSSMNALACEGDRIEIYRPLLADPKAARRKRANDEKKKTM